MSALPDGVDISSKADAMFVGVMLAPVLSGITISQSWTYYNSNKDGWMLRSFVGLLVLMDMTETVLTSVMAHEYLITNFGNLEGLTRLPITTIVEVAINIVLVMLVELFFAYRVYLLTRQIVLPILIALFGVAGLAAGICLVANISRSFEVSALASESMKIEVSLANAFEAISDLLATFALSIAFMKGRRHGLKSTTTMLNKLLGFTIARGGLVTVAQFLTLAFYVAWPTRLYWMPIHFVEGKLCVITMLVMYALQFSSQNLYAPMHPRSSAAVVGTALSVPTQEDGNFKRRRDFNCIHGMSAVNVLTARWAGSTLNELWSMKWTSTGRFESLSVKADIYVWEAFEKLEAF